MDKKDNVTIESWIFGGTRVSKTNKRIHLWIDKNGNELLFKASSSYSVGYIYEAKVERQEGEKVFLLGTPRFTGIASDDKDLVNKLSANNRASLATLSLITQERAAKKNDKLEIIIQQIINLTRSTPRSQRVAFITYITNRLLNETSSKY